jgi:hypothetical protein
MGLLAEATLPEGTRWIPKGIRLDYVAKVWFCTARRLRICTTARCGAISRTCGRTEAK